MSLFPPPLTRLPPSFSSKHQFIFKPTLSLRPANPHFLLSTSKASTDDGGAGVSASAATVEEPKLEQKAPDSSESVPVAEKNSNGAVVPGGGVEVEVSKFEDPRWISGTWDLKQFEKDGKTDWDAVIDAEVRRRKWLEGNPESSSNDDPVVFDTSIIPWWSWMKRFHLPEAELLNGRAAMIGFFMGVDTPSFEQNESIGNLKSSRVKQFVKYISDLETKGNATIVPEFPGKLDWLNTSPLQFQRDLKGKVVLLDFWTYCCINCMHVLPDLEYLEKKYKDAPFTVVGVHSAKFDNEKDLEAIRNAVLRYNISHPVVNDGDMFLWRELGVSSWPTFAIVGPNGKLIAQLSGEGRRKDLDDLIEAVLLYYGERKILNSRPIPLSLEKNNDPRLLSSPLKFPGKLAIDVLNNRLFISDSNHNRIVVTDLDGNFIAQIGSSGEEGLRDGSFDDATFNRPQGLAYNSKKNTLYVADTENHALREVDFVSEKVRTLAGNGTKGSDYQGGGKGTDQVLNSPWDVSFEPVNEKVYIAMAGQHQIWEHDISNGVTRAFSGDGYERNLNGSSPTSTSFAQPSGVSLSPDFELYVADSESSSIRVLSLRTKGTRLLAGGDPIFPDNLFKFGDHDGIGSEVLLQHPLGVLHAKDGLIYIADSYNHKIKKLDLATKRVTTIAGTGKAGFKDGKALTAQLSEPAGLIEAENGRLIIADTNNSVIRYLDLNKGEAELLTLELKGVQPPASKSKSLKRLRKRSSADTETIKVDGSSSSEGNLRIKISVPEEYHFSKEARSKFSVETEPENAVLIDPSEGYLSSGGTASIHFKRSDASPSMGRINCKVYYCKEDEVCLYQSLLFEVPFQEETPDSTPSEITLAYLVKPKSSPSKLQLPITG